MTGKKLLEKGELQRRYTIIPLNKISAKTLNDRVINAAKNLVRESSECLGLKMFGEVVKVHLIFFFPPRLLKLTIDSYCILSVLSSSRLEWTMFTQLCP